jgi:hypothetical protein
MMMVAHVLNAHFIQLNVVYGQPIEMNSKTLAAIARNAMNPRRHVTYAKLIMDVYDPKTVTDAMIVYARLASTLMKETTELIQFVKNVFIMQLAIHVNVIHSFTGIHTT